MPVWELLREKLPITAALTVMSFLLILVLSVPLGIYTAQREGTWADRILMVLDQAAMSVPGFFWRCV